jgi:small nuclear ribonucleoprotein (snRNP)-like protein
MRVVESIVLISLLTVHSLPVSAQEAPPSRELQEILASLPREAERFSRLQASPVVTTQADDHPASQRDRANDAERIRAKVLETPIGSEVTTTLHSGETLRAELTEVTESYFRLRVAAPEHARRAYGEDATIRERFHYDEVRTFWWGQDPRNIAAGKRVEVRLVGGKKARGHLRGVSDEGVTVDDRLYPFDEVVSVRKLGLRTVYKVLIPVGALFGTMAIVCGSGYCSQ